MWLSEKRILSRASRDIVIASWTNRKTLDKLHRNGYVLPLGPANNGKHEGKTGFLISAAGEKYLEQLRKQEKEDRRFWVTIVASVLSGAIGFILGKIFP